jgi:hypothetical protein
MILFRTVGLKCQFLQGATVPGFIGGRGATKYLWDKVYPAKEYARGIEKGKQIEYRLACREQKRKCP